MVSTPKSRCPYPECPSQTQKCSLGVVRHGFMKSKHGARLRMLCQSCGRTFCNRKGTAYYRLQRPRQDFDRFAGLLSEGMSGAALARTLDVSPSTISRWLARAARHAKAFGETHDKIENPVEIQFDELSARPASESKSPWIFNGIEVWSRYWVAAHVGRRSRRSTREFVLRSRNALGQLPRSVLITSDPFEFYAPTIARTFGPTCVYVQVKNAYRQNKVLRTTPELVLGTEDELDALVARSEDSKRLNTSYVERLNLHLRRSCSYLHRRTSGRVRNPARLASAVEILRCFYNFIRPHQALRFGTVTRTPAMQAGAATRPLSWREVFCWIVPHSSRNTVPARG